MATATFTFAKREFDNGFHVLDQVIAEVVGSHGDGGLAHPLAQVPVACKGMSSCPQ